MQTRNAVVIVFLLTLASTVLCGLPVVIGHRGDSDYAPENTMPAFIMAMQNGAVGFETDLRTSSDGYIVLIHDATLDRTTNCSYSAPEGQCKCGNVNDLTLAALKTCDAGIKFGAQWAGTQIPTFEEAVQYLSTVGGVMVMDLKTDDQDHGLLGEKISPIVEEYGVNSLVTASCWTIDQIENMNQFLKSSPKQFLGSMPTTFNNDYFAQVIEAGVRGFSLDYTTTTAQFVAQAHLRLLPVFAWTITDQAGVLQCLDNGFDGILTNDVQMTVSVLQSYYYYRQ